MKRALAIAVLLHAVTASAEAAGPAATQPAEGFAERTSAPAADEPAQAPAKPAAPAAEPATEPPDVPAGALLEVGIADSSSFSPLVSTNNFGLGNSTSIPTLVPTIRAGAYLGQHHEFSLGLSFSYLQVSNGGSQTTIFDVVLAPTYRYHFVPLKPWGLSPFLQVELLLGIDDIGSSGSSSTTTPEFGATAGMGAEYMLGDRFGLLINAGVRFVSLSLGNNGFGSGTSVLGFQVWGSAAASLHF